MFGFVFIFIYKMECVCCSVKTAGYRFRICGHFRCHLCAVKGLLCFECLSSDSDLLQRMCLVENLDKWGGTELTEDEKRQKAEVETQFITEYQEKAITAWKINTDKFTKEVKLMLKEEEIKKKVVELKVRTRLLQATAKYMEQADGRVKEVYDRILKKINKKRKNICGVCMEKSVKLFLGCGHCLCVRCYKSLNNKLCPFCRRTIKCAKKIYF